MPAVPEITIVHAAIDPATGFIYQDMLGINTSGTGAKYLSDGFEWKVVEFDDLNGEVTNAMLRDGGACSVIGRAANSSGDVADISAASNGYYLVRRSDSVQFAALLASDLSGDITNAMLRDGAACSVIGRSANSSGDVDDIVASANGKYLTRQSNALSFAALLASDLSGAVAIANGGTGQTTQTAAMDALSPVTTKGDLIVRDGSNNVRLAVGTDGKLLMADSSATPGVAYAFRPMVVTFQAASGTDLTWTNMPAGVTLLVGSARHVQKHDLSGFKQARLCCWRGSAAAAGATSKIYLRYYTSHSTLSTDYLTIGSSEVTVNINSTNAFLDSGWVDLVSGAKADNLFLAVIGENGDGVADPTFGTIYAAFR